MTTFTLSNFTNPNGNKVWQAMLRGMPICREVETREQAAAAVTRAIAEQNYLSRHGKTVNQINEWDGDASVLTEDVAL